MSGRNYRPGPTQPRDFGHQGGVVIDYDHARSSGPSRPYQPPTRQYQPPSNQFERLESFEDDDDDDDEEIIPLPEDLARKFGKLTCELCLCTLPSVKQANMHYEGKQHEKRVMRYLEEWSNSLNRKIPNCWLKLVCKRKKNTKLPSSCDVKFCGVCNIVLTSAVVAEQHYSGRSHNTALKLYKGKSGSCNIQSNPKSQFICDICNVVTSCQEHLENHMRGSKHKKVLLRLKEAECLEMYGGYDDEEQLEEEQKEAQDYNVIQSSSGDVQYECVYCTWRGRPADFEAHKERLTHIAAVEEESKQNAQQDDDDDDDGVTIYTDVMDLFCKLCNIQLTSKKEVTKHIRSRDHLEEMNLRKKQVMLSMDDKKKTVVEEEHKCDLCLMKFPSKSMYDAHLQWKRHVKKLANKMQSECKKRCELCQMDFFSEQMYNAHLSTKRHRNNEQWLKKNRSKDDTGSKNKTGVKESQNNISGTEGNKDEDRENNTGTKKSTESNSENNSENLIKIEGDVTESKTPEPKECDVSKSAEDKVSNKTADDETPEEMTVYECEVCEISVCGKLPYEQHLISARHILQCSLKQATVSETPNKQNQSVTSAKPAATFWKTNRPLFCKLCHVTSLTKYQHELHLSSKKHKDAVTKLEILKFEPKAKMAMSYKPPTPQNMFATERKPASYEKYGQLGNFAKQDSFKQFENTANNDAVCSRNQSNHPEKPFFMQPSREMSNMPPCNDFSHMFKQEPPRKDFPQPFRQEPPRNDFPQPFRQEPPPNDFPQPFRQEPDVMAHSLNVPQPIGMGPNVPPGVPQPHFPSMPGTEAQSFARERFVAVPPPVVPIEQPSVVEHVEAGIYSGNVAASTLPIRRSTYSCKDCGAAFISGVDFKHHANLCKKKERSEESKDLSVKPSNLVIQNNPYRCEACDVEYTSYRAFLEHKASAEHEANIEHLRDFGKRLRPVRKEKKKRESDHLLRSEHKGRGLQNSKAYECKRCDVTFYAQQAFNVHLNSAGHLRKPVTFKREIISYRQGLREASVSPDRDTRDERERRRSRSPRERRRSREQRPYERSSRGLLSESLDQKGRVDVHDKYLDRVCNSPSSDSDSDGMDLLPLKKTRRQFECTVCDKTCSSENDYKEHLKGKAHRSKMCVYECGDCSALFSTKYDLSNHMCDLGKIRSIEGGGSGKWLQNWDSQERADQSRAGRQRNTYLKPRNSYEADSALVDEEDNLEISRNLLLQEQQSEPSLLSTFSFKRETYEIMTDSHGMSGFF